MSDQTVKERPERDEQSVKHLVVAVAVILFAIFLRDILLPYLSAR